MAKNRFQDHAEGSTPEVITPAPTAQVGNFTLTYRRMHPKDRCSYGIDGNSGIVVFDLGLFKGGKDAGFVPPATLTLDALLVPVKLDNKTAKAEAAAAKAAEREAKAKAKLEAAQAKVAAKEAEAKARLEKAQAKIAALQAKTADAPVS